MGSALAAFLLMLGATSMRRAARDSNHVMAGERFDIANPFRGIPGRPKITSRIGLMGGLQTRLFARDVASHDHATHFQ